MQQTNQRQRPSLDNGDIRPTLHDQRARTRPKRQHHMRGSPSVCFIIFCFIMCSSGGLWESFLRTRPPPPGTRFDPCIENPFVLRFP